MAKVIMSYNPNLNDLRIQRRVSKALVFADAFLSDRKPRAWSTRYIDKYFGQQQNELSRWLRARLLICTNERYAKDSGMCKEYIKNVDGIVELSSVIGKDKSIKKIAKDIFTEEYSTQLSTKKFEYREKSFRLWHDLQRIKRDYKQDLFQTHGFKFQYDIECCAPTLIHQYSQMIPEIVTDKWQQGPMDLYLFAIRRYLKDKNEVRHELANNAEITYELAKEIINALLMGAHLSNNKDSDIYQLLKGDRAKIEYLKQDLFLSELRSDIKTCWEYIRPTLTKRTIITKSGIKRTLAVSTKQKAGVYFFLERSVLNSIRHFLDGSDINYFLEHDGFFSDQQVDMDQLSKRVYFDTGFDIKFDMEMIS